MRFDMILSILGNAELKLNEAAGPALGVEVRMRLIGEMSKEVRDRLKELVLQDYKERKKENPKAKKESSDFEKCDLFFLNAAIREVFKDQLNAVDLEELRKCTPYRNKTLHGDFVGLLEKMGMILLGRQLISIAGERNALKSSEIKESLVSIANGSPSFNQACIRLRHITGILNGIIGKIEQSYAKRKL